MSRAFAPPDTLSPDDIRTVADVRRTVWINGIFGLGAGAATGTVSHLILQALQKKYIGDQAASSGPKSSSAAANSPVTPTAASKVNPNSWIYKCLRPLPPLGKNTFMLALLGGGALGSFIMSSTAGKNVVHLLHPVFQAGRDEHAGKSPYQIATIKAAENDTTTNPNSVTNNDIEEDELDAAHHRTRSLQRKASMKERLETGQSLSGTHGNTWPHNDEMDDTEEMVKDKSMHRAEVWGRRQTNRKKVVQDRIERGKALSDSTGGQWSKENDGGK